MAEAKVTQASSSNESRHSVSAPAISLPKGGGAIRGIDKKFVANPITGTDSSRADFGHKFRYHAWEIGESKERSV
jgi:hypothetical protein